MLFSERSRTFHQVWGQDGKGQITQSHFTSFTSGLITKCNTRKDTIFWHIFGVWSHFVLGPVSTIRMVKIQVKPANERHFYPFMSGGLSEYNKLYHVRKWRGYPEDFISSCVPSCLRSLKAFGKMCYLLSILPYKKSRDLKLKAN